MKHYYYAENDQQFGPFTVDELKTKRLKKSTLVWTEGMQDWMSANEIEELNEILISEPPPLPKKTTTITKVETIQFKNQPTSVKINKYDQTYEKETEATILGVLVLIIVFMIASITFETEEGYNQAKAPFAIGSLILRVVFTVYVVNIASRQNRNSTGWGWFAFFLPSIALIVIGQLKKLRLKIELDGSLSANQQVAILFEKANRLFSNNRHSECIEILNKAIEIDNENFDCIKLRGLASYNIKNYQKAKSDFELLIKNEKFPSVANFYLGNLAILDKDRELAISFWLKAAELNNENAKIKLDQYHTFIGKYILNSSQVLKKVTSNSLSEFLYLCDGKYIGGLQEIDNIENPSKLKTLIFGYEYGLNIELKKKFKTFHIAVSYCEIQDIIYNESNKTFELHLNDKNILKFSYGSEIKNNTGLKDMCKNLNEATGKTPQIVSFWRD